jgi:hypothetical protein
MAVGDMSTVNLQAAETVRAALIAAAQEAYESAGISGLCAEGRWENAVGAMQSLNLHALLAKREAK